MTESVDTKFAENKVKNDIDVVLAQAPDGVTREAATEALVLSCGDVAQAIAMLWSSKPTDITASKPEFLVDSVQQKWASVREIADSITDTREIHRAAKPCDTAPLQ
jgi:hypothetical protein